MSALIIGLLRLFYRLYSFSAKTLSVFVIVVFLGTLFFAIKFTATAIRSIQRKTTKTAVCFVLLAIYFLISAWKYTYYFDWTEKEAQLELIAELNGTVEYENTEAYFRIHRFPFVLESMYTGEDGPKRSDSEDVDVSELRRIVDVNEPYTYLISYGRQIKQLTYHCWNGADYLPAPWNGLVYEANCTYKTNEENKLDQKIYIYRIPLSPIDKEP